MSASTSNEARPAPSTSLAILAASLPLVFLVLACPLAAIAHPGDLSGSGLRYAIQDGGAAIFLVFGASLVSVVALAVLLALSAKGWRVAAVFPVGFAALPWLCGLLGALFGMSQARDAIENADPVVRAAMTAKGIAEATTNSFFGAALSSALLAAVGLALAIAALAQRAPKRGGIGALLGGGAMLPLLAMALWAATTVHITGALELVLAALGAVLAAALSGFATGADAPHGRSGALGAAACVASGLAVVAGASLAAASSTMEIFGALAFADPSSRAELLAMAAEELGPLAIASFFALPLALIPSALVAVLAALRVRPTAGRIAGAVGLIVLAAAVVAADAIVRGRGGALLMAAVNS